MFSTEAFGGVGRSRLSRAWREHWVNIGRVKMRILLKVKSKVILQFWVENRKRLERCWILLVRSFSVSIVLRV